jgi:nitrogen regulatory protein P-II 1
VKKLEAIINAQRLDDVKEALAKAGVEAWTVLEAKGMGHEEGQREIYRGVEYVVDFRPRVKIELFVSDNAASAAVEAIRHAAHTGRHGDGNIFVWSIEDGVHIASGEHGLRATA